MLASSRRSGWLTAMALEPVMSWPLVLPPFRRAVLSAWPRSPASLRCWCAFARTCTHRPP
eukprot:2247479-Alexandrium_andersonii.AAC.1